ncbi:MAG: preprotein translocase subunit SecA [Candidatus Cloacimonadota bacterium]|nr:MAG: preprotein translocase subunit SecA [Candidatus Cloacimonadota bacterium]
MILDAIKSFLPKTYNDRQVRKLQLVVDEIDALSPKMEAMDDSTLQNQTALLRIKVQEQLDDDAEYFEALEYILPEAYATVREAAHRLLGERHYNCQLIGGLVLFRGNICEMKTGEGKTLASTLPTYLHGLMGRGVHVVTVNDYLAKRDSEWMGKVHEFLGLSVGLIHHNQDTEPKAKAYQCDITYGTNNEFGFDYLRDNMASDASEMVQRKNYCIIDEVDSILIDEARTPLIISGPGEGNVDLYMKMAKWVKLLEKDIDFTVDEKAHSVYLTDEGIAKGEKVIGIENLYAQENLKLLHHLEASLKAENLFHLDQNYVVQNGEVVIIDEFTGRMMPGRRYSDGIHGAIEAKEGVQVQQESSTLAQVTFQNFFKLYTRLAGMTGTALTEVREFGEIYDLDVIAIPPNRVLARQDLPDKIYKTQKEKYEAIIITARDCHESGQPLLIGTISIENSEIIANLLRNENIPCSVLNAKYHQQEAEIVTNAGQKGTITIATNMAGRGTDIKLGEGVADVGGLFILGSERHESRRIDNQLRGRSGRQGDPGVTQFFLSLEDDLMRVFGGDRMTNMMNFVGWEYGETIDSKMVSKALESAQARVENMHFEARKHILKYDNVMNEHRRIIYDQRKMALTKENLQKQIIDMMQEAINKVANSFVNEEVPRENWDYEEVQVQMFELFNYKMNEEQFKLEPKALRESLFEGLKEQFAKREQNFGQDFMRHVEKAILLQTVDQCWREHLSQMEQLKEGIGLRGYGQKDPLVEYKLESIDLFNEMIQRIREDTISLLFKLDFNPDQEMEIENQDTSELVYSSTEEELEELQEQQEQKHVPLKAQKIGRNDPCPCGSGKKYKRCHGKS